MSERKFEEIDHVDVHGDNPDWVLRFEKSRKDSEEGFRFAWIHKSSKPNFAMNAFVQTDLLFKCIAEAARKGMIR
jgi:hypothetical protein